MTTFHKITFEVKEYVIMSLSARTDSQVMYVVSSVVSDERSSKCNSNRGNKE